MRRFSFLLALLLVSAAASAARLTQYKDWLRSPEAYFLTAEERQAWREVQTDDQAAAFVAAFREKRGGSAFTNAIAERAAIAEKYFTLPKVKGIDASTHKETFSPSVRSKEVKARMKSAIEGAIEP